MSYSLEKYNCQLCDKKSNQKSHHETHIKSEHHKDKVEILRLKLDNNSIKKLKTKYGYSELSKIVEMMSGMESTYKLKLQKKSNKVVYKLTKDELDQNKEYEEFKNKFKNKLKSWHNLLSGSGVTGDPALDDIIHIIMLCYLEEKKETFSLLDKNSYPIVKVQRLEKYFECLSIDYILKNQSNLCKSKNTSDGKSIMEKIGEVLSNHNIFAKIIKDTNFINCKKNNVLYELITNINNFCVENNIFQYSDIIGIAYEFWANEYKGSGGKELGNFFTERILMRMCFELIESDDIKEMKIDNNSTIGDEFCGTFGFPLYLKLFLKNKYNIDIKNNNIYGIEFEDRASKLAILNAMFSLGTVDNIKRGDSFITNVNPHLDLSVHNVPFGKRMKVKHIENNYNDYKANNNIPDFHDIIPVEANKDAILASQMVIYKTSKMGLCIIKDGEEATGTTKSLVDYRKYICDSVNVKKILKIPSGAFSCTGTKTLCFYFVKDGTKTDNIQFLELDEMGTVIKEICNVSYEDLEHNNYLWCSSFYIVDEELEKMKTKSICEWKKLGEVCEIANGNFNSNDMDNNGNIPFYTCVSNNPVGFHSKKTFDYEKYILLITAGGSQKNLTGDNVGLGKCYLVDGETACRSGVKALIIKYQQLRYDYLHYYLKNTRHLTNKLADFTTNLGVIKNEKLNNLQIPIPSFEIQKETIESIKVFDNMIKSLESINKEHKKGIKLYMNIIIKKNLDTIEWKELGDICELLNGNFNSSDMDNDGNIPFYTCVANNPVGFHSKETFDYEKYILLITAGGSQKNLIGDTVGLGKCYLVDGKTACRSGVKALTIKYQKLRYEYLYHYLNNTRHLTNKLADFTTNLGVIKNEKLNNLQIPIPSIELQEDIVKYLDNINNNISNNKEIIGLYKENIKNILEQSYQ